MADSEKKRILIVDDDRHLVTTLRDYLSFKGYDVDTASSAEGALQTLQSATPDLIILDIGMPGMGGMGFLKRMEVDGTNDIPILVLTAKAIMEDFFSELDVSGFIAKPCREDDLLRKIREIVSRSTASKTVDQPVQRRVLLVEDDSLVNEEIQRTFARESRVISFDTTPTAAEGIQKAVSAKPDLVMANEVLRGMNGADMAALMHQMPQLRSVPIVLYRKSLQAEGLWLFEHRVFGKQSGYAQATDGVALHDLVCKLLGP